MKKIWIAGLLTVCSMNNVYGQGKILTNDGIISFYTHTVIEDITATHQNVASVIDAASGEVAIIVTMTGFQFEKKLMQEHFNENYVESHKYPKATFSGKIENNSRVNYQQPGTYPVQVSGEMTIHGVTRAVSTEGSIEIKPKGIIANTKFMLNPEDYGIRIPRVVRKNIAEKMEITAQLVLNPS